ncbi:DUF4126 domain-containing protein [Agromyces sp. H3Y2-19a]|uniref:DUF4126 domain-containing protein n=1 Tax=Agromyces chromiiresistens TaxID=3030835 RepID=UPI0023B8B252|nr:DUF4126 domain-containing protein [Agromyces chromiiresistens]MDF0515258.1 DUF4126 domain-containing protein [Agromyces chromiiresistens]
MLELLTGTGLALAAGLNAWIPLVVLGALDRFTTLVELPPAWAWLSNEWVLLVLALLLAVEFIADKVPGLDSANDVVQTVVRPTAGGIVFGTGIDSTTAVVTDPGSFFSSNAWVPVAIGVGLALLVHVAKAAARPVVNTATLGFGGPVVSAAEDAGSFALAFAAVLAPVLVVFGIVALVIALVFVVRRRRARREAAARHPATTP